MAATQPVPCACNTALCCHVGMPCPRAVRMAHSPEVMYACRFIGETYQAAQLLMSCSAA
jgi:hypothetical protein